MYVDPAEPVTAAIRRRGALGWLDGSGALSHTTALGLWGLHEPAADEAVHVTVPRAVRLRSRPGVAVHRIRLGGRSVYLDLYAEREMVNVELDGASVHADRRQREVDLRRDALLATLGILVVRFTHRRLVAETEAVRREALAILARRRGSAVPT